MPRSLHDRLGDVHPKMARVEGEWDPKKLAEPDRRREVGQLVERAIVLTGETKQGAAAQMGYRDAGVISRWCSALERPLFDKLLEVTGPAMTFEDAWLLALAERNRRMEVITEIRVRRSA